MNIQYIYIYIKHILLALYPIFSSLFLYRRIIIISTNRSPYICRDYKSFLFPRSLARTMGKQTFATRSFSVTTTASHSLWSVHWATPPTDIHEFNAIGLDGLQRSGHVLEVMVLVDRPRVPPGQPLPGECLHQGAEPRAVAEVVGEIEHRAELPAPLRVLQMLVHPVAKGVRLDVHPEVLVALDRHALGGRALGRASHQTHQLGRLQLLRSSFLHGVRSFGSALIAATPADIDTQTGLIKRAPTLGTFRNALSCIYAGASLSPLRGCTLNIYSGWYYILCAVGNGEQCRLTAPRHRDHRESMCVCRVLFFIYVYR